MAKFDVTVVLTIEDLAPQGYTPELIEEYVKYQLMDDDEERPEFDQILPTRVFAVAEVVTV